MEEFEDIIDNEPVEQKPPQTFPRISHITLFIFGYLVLTIISYLVVEALQLRGSAFVNSLAYPAVANFTIYILTFLFLALFLHLQKYLIPLAKTFTKLRPYLYGLMYGIALILITTSFSIAIDKIFDNTSVNENETSVRALISAYPLSSFVWIVLLGPMVEEVIYRVGLFHSLRKHGRIVAYAFSGLIFGLIHFNIPYDADNNIIQSQLIVELINLPSYILSGLGFAYIYEKEGYVGSTTAHVFNNLLSFILTVIGING